ncbi:hypothetical protein quinque_008851 [Culex quinquefasciatus]
MNVVIFSITVVLGMLDKVLLCAELSPGAESRRERIFFVVNIPAMAKIRMITNDPGVDDVRNFIVANHSAVAKLLMIESDPEMDEVRIFIVANLPAVAKMIENDPVVDEVRILFLANLPSVAKLLIIENDPVL